MPFIDCRVSVPLTQEKREALKSALGKAVAILHKPERYLMVQLTEGCDLYFAGKRMQKAAYVAVSLFGNASEQDYEAMTRAVCDILARELAIAGDAVYCKGKIRTTPFAVSFGRFAVHRLCNTWVLLHPLRGRSSQNLHAKGAKQSKAARRAIRRGEARSACRVARARASTMHERLGFRF